MSEIRPDPFTPPECNLRGFQWMPIDTVRLLDSDLFLIASGDEFKAALALWCKSWAQVPAASLPADERLLAGLSGAGTKWKKVRDVAMRGWVMCADGRYYHAVVAEKALEAWVMAKAHADEKAAAAERKALERADRTRMFKLLRERGTVADFHTTTTKLREMVAALTPLPSAAGEGGAEPPVTRDKSQPVTAKTRQDRTGPDQTQLNSAPNGAGGPAAVIALAAGIQTGTQDLTDAEEKLLWNAALAMLIPSYSTGTEKSKDAKARLFVGRLGKDLKEAGVSRRGLFDVIQAACVERPVNPETWMAAAVARRIGTRQAPNRQEAQEQRNHDQADDWAARKERELKGDQDASE